MSESAPRPLRAVQAEFAAYIRHPERNPLPVGIEERRMRIYARLFYNTVESCLAATFRVFRRTVGKPLWHALVRDFMHRHRAESPYYARIPEEFLDYLSGLDAGPARSSEDGETAPRVPPFALELCHYEWVKRALEQAPDAECRFDDAQLGEDDVVQRSPLAWPLRYAYPVTRVGPDFQPETPPTAATCLIVYRDRDDRVRVMSASPGTLALLQAIGAERTVGDCLRAVAPERSGRDAATMRVEQSGLAMLNRLHRHDIVVRAAKASGSAAAGAR